MEGEVTTTLQITLPMPPSVNTLYPTRGERRVKSRAYKTWIDTAWWYLRGTYGPQPKLKGRYRLHYLLPLKDKRARDASNYEKAITDLLVSMEILQGDDWRYVKAITCEWAEPGERKSVLVTIRGGEG